MKPFWAIKPFQVRWKEPLGKPECPYGYRWVFTFFGYAIRIHKWLRSDDSRYLHSHSWFFITFVLRGFYTDVSLQDEKVVKELCRPFCFYYRPASHLHYVKVPKTGCTTILFTGKPVHKWGFYVNGKFIRPLKFFHKYGHPACDEQ